MRKADQAKLVQEAQQLTKNWPKVKLGEVLKYRKEFIMIDDLAIYKRPRVQLHAQGIVLRDEVLGALIKTKTQQVCHAGEFLVAEIDAKVGGIGIVPDALQGAIVSSHYFLFTIDESKLDRHFLDYFIRTPAFLEQVEAQGSTNYAAIRPAHVLGYDISLPPLTEQQRIVARIEDLAAQIRKVRILQDQVAAEIEALVISVHIQLSGKRIKNIGQFLRLDEDKVAVSPTEEYPQVGVRSFAGGLFPKAAANGTGTTYKSYNRLYDGAVVLSQVKGWEGAIAVCTSDLDGWFVSPEYRTFRCIPGEASSEYLAALFRTEWFWGRLKKATRGVGARRERTRPEQFMDIEIPIPDMERQKIGEHLFAEIGKLNPLQAQTATELDALLPSILDRAFKGELL